MSYLTKIVTKVVRQEPIQTWVIDQFHRLWYHSRATWQQNTFLGYPVLQLPSDLWTYQELIYACRPHFILQTGVKDGGSIAYFAHLLDAMGAPPESLVVGVDLVLTASAKKLNHARVRLIEGSSVDPDVLAQVRALCPEGRGFVSLDSDHSCDHVLRELALYWPFVAPDAYLVVEDTNVNGHPVLRDFGPGPHEAVAAFLPQGVPFKQDEAPKHRQLFTQHTWLRRTR